MVGREANVYAFCAARTMHVKETSCRAWAVVALDHGTRNTRERAVR